MRKFVGLTLAVSLICIVLFISTNENNQVKEDDDGKLKVVTSFYAMKALVEELGGDKVNIYNITPEGSEPHDFEPKAKDIKAIEDGDIFIYNGAGMEHWVDKALEVINNKNLIIVKASDGVDILKDETQKEDPHVWLGISAVKIEAQNIKAALIEKDKINSEYYNEKYIEFINKMNSIEEEYVDKYNKLNKKAFVTGHATFGYLCKDLGLQQNSIEGIFAEGEPSPKQLQELITYCKANEVKVIFVEELISKELTDTLAKEVGAKTEKIYTLHSSEDGKNFSDRIKYNVETIYEAIKSN